MNITLDKEPSVVVYIHCDTVSGDIKPHAKQTEILDNLTGLVMNTKGFRQRGQ